MANEEHLSLIRQSVEAWNQWREDNPGTLPNLSRANLVGADLSGVDLSGADLREADLSEANLSWTDLREANLSGADLREADLSEANLSRADLIMANLRRADFIMADLSEADLSEANLCGAKLGEANLSDAVLNEANLRGANLIMANLRRADLILADLREADLIRAILSEADFSGADFSGADLSGADISEANLSGANLSRADMSGASLIRTRLESADLTGSRVYGVSAWDLEIANAIQQDLVITPDDQPSITVDDLEVAQFIYLMLNNEKIRRVIDTITSKSVLILGRFTVERKAVLDAIRNELRRRNYLPILFDFEKPTNKDFSETIMTLAGMCKFIIADISNPKSSPLELQAAVPNFMTPFVPIIQEDEKPFAMFKDLKGKYNWVVDLLEYDSVETLIQVIEPAIILPAEQKSDELMLLKAEELVTRRASDYLK